MGKLSEDKSSLSNLEIYYTFGELQLLFLFTATRNLNSPNLNPFGIQFSFVHKINNLY